SQSARPFRPDRMEFEPNSLMLQRQHPGILPGHQGIAQPTCKWGARTPFRSVSETGQDLRDFTRQRPVRRALRMGEDILAGPALQIEPGACRQEAEARLRE